VAERAEQKCANTEAVTRKSTVLLAQVSWCANAWNATPEQAARQIVTDLFEHLSNGGTISVRVEGLDGSEHTLEVTAGR
jgi:hypothetical protein